MGVMDIPFSLGRESPFIAGLAPLLGPPRGLTIPGLMTVGLTPGLMIGLMIGLIPGLTLMGPTGLAPGLTATLMMGCLPGGGRALIRGALT